MSIQRAFPGVARDPTDPKDVGWLEDFPVDAASFATNAMVGVRMRAVSSGTGAVINSSSLGVDNISKARGVVTLATGTTTTGRSSLVGGAASTRFMDGIYTLTARLFLVQASIVSDEFTFSIGYHNDLDSTTLNAQNGAWFRYNRAVDGDFWTCHTANNSDKDPTNPTNHTKTVTTVVPIFTTASAMQRLKIVIDRSTVANFYINDVLVVSHTTNIPTDRFMGTGCRILKSAGTTSCKVAVDYIGERVLSDVAR